MDSINQIEKEKFIWAIEKIRKAQDDKAFCSIVVHIKDGQIIRAERNESYVPPSPGELAKKTGY